MKKLFIAQRLDSDKALILRDFGSKGHLAPGDIALSEGTFEDFTSAKLLILVYSSESFEYTVSEYATATFMWVAGQLGVDADEAAKFDAESKELSSRVCEQIRIIASYGLQLGPLGSYVVLLDGDYTLEVSWSDSRQMFWCPDFSGMRISGFSKTAESYTDYANYVLLLSQILKDLEETCR